MKNNNDFINKMDDGLKKFDFEMIKTLKKIEQNYSGEEIPPKIQKKLNELVDLRKDFAEKIYDLKLVVESSWENLENDTSSALQKLTQSTQELSKKLD